MGRILRLVDGVPHIVLGPLALLAVGPLGRALGVPAPALAVFLAVFTAYGVAVVGGLHLGRGRVPAWLAALALVVNGAFLGAVAVSLASPHLTTAGRLLHVALLLTGATVTVLLARAAGHADARRSPASMAP